MARSSQQVSALLKLESCQVLLEGFFTGQGTLQFLFNIVTLDVEVEIKLAMVTYVPKPVYLFYLGEPEESVPMTGLCLHLECFLDAGMGLLRVDKDELDLAEWGRV